MRAGASFFLSSAIPMGFIGCSAGNTGRSGDQIYQMAFTGTGFTTRTIARTDGAEKCQVCHNHWGFLFYFGANFRRRPVNFPVGATLNPFQTIDLSALANVNQVTISQTAVGGSAGAIIWDDLVYC